MTTQYVNCPYCAREDQEVDVDDDSNTLWNCNKCYKPMVVVTKTSVKVHRVEGYFGRAKKKRMKRKAD